MPRSLLLDLSAVTTPSMLDILKIFMEAPLAFNFQEAGRGNCYLHHSNLERTFFKFLKSTHWKSFLLNAMKLLGTWFLKLETKFVTHHQMVSSSSPSENTARITQIRFSILFLPPTKYSPSQISGLDLVSYVMMWCSSPKGKHTIFTTFPHPTESSPFKVQDISRR